MLQLRIWLLLKANRVKITQRQLRRIIRESLEEKYGKDYLSKTHSDGGSEEKDPKLDFIEELDESDAAEADWWFEFGMENAS